MKCSRLTEQNYDAFKDNFFSLANFDIKYFRKKMS